MQHCSATPTYMYVTWQSWKRNEKQFTYFVPKNTSDFY